jgi:hypothetical protein
VAKNAIGIWVLSAMGGSAFGGGFGISQVGLRRILYNDTFSLKNRGKEI